MDNFHKKTTLVCTIFVVFFMFSQATAMPFINNYSKVNTKEDRISNIFEEEISKMIGKIDDGVFDKHFEKISFLCKQKFSREMLLESTDIIPILKNTQESLSKFDYEKLGGIADLENITAWIRVLVKTIIAEFIVYVIFSPLFSDLSFLQISNMLMISIMINTLTNPATNFIYFYIYDNLYALEAIVAGVESFMIFILFKSFSIDISFIEATILSFAANTFSFVAASDTDVFN